MKLLALYMVAVASSKRLLARFLLRAPSVPVLAYQDNLQRLAGGQDSAALELGRVQRRSVALPLLL